MLVSTPGETSWKLDGTDGWDGKIVGWDNNKMAMENSPQIHRGIDFQEVFSKRDVGGYG